MSDNAENAGLRKRLARFLSAGRFEHSLNVASAARRIAMVFQPDLAEAAATAGLLHDNAKSLSDEELLSAARRLDIESSAVESSCPALLHGKVGAALVTERFGITDEGIIRAIADHVTGRVGMGRLSLILFVADQVADDRDFPGVAELRRVSGTDLNQAAFMVAKHKLAYAVELERPVEPTTVAVYNELLARIEMNGNR